MSASEIIDLLEKEKKPLSRREIAEKIDATPCRVSHHLKKLVIHKEVQVLEISRFDAKIYFKNNAPSRRMRLYFV
jgi:DNA-binding transcriptional ArsR family regulator